MSHEDARRLKIPRLGIIEGSFKWVNEEVAAVVISQTYYIPCKDYGATEGTAQPCL